MTEIIDNIDVRYHASLGQQKRATMTEEEIKKATQELAKYHDIGKPSAPKKIYVQPDAYDRWWEGSAPNEKFVEYIRKDEVEHIIRSALGGKDALLKIRSL